MKKYIALILVMASYSLLAVEYNAMVITKAKDGLFADYVGVLANLIWCEENSITPVVYWGNNSEYYQKEGYNGSENVWEYYFEQVSALSYKPGDAKDGLLVWEYGRNPAGYIIPRSFDKDYLFMLEKSYRARIHKIVDKYIKLKPAVSEKIEQFYRIHMAGKKTIGIHLRGTDKKKRK